MGHITVLLLICLQFMAISYAYDNQYGGLLVSMCPNNKVLYKVQSKHSNIQRDRRWKLKCKNAFATANCQWTSFVNHLYQLMVFQCPGSKFINGAVSYFVHSDRRWAFQCCERPKYHTAYCYYTGWKNAFDKQLKLTLSSYRYIRGVVSEYSHKHRDRRFQFHICKLRKNK